MESTLFGLAIGDQITRRVSLNAINEVLEDFELSCPQMWLVAKTRPLEVSAAVPGTTRKDLAERAWNFLLSSIEPDVVHCATSDPGYVSITWTLGSSMFAKLRTVSRYRLERYAMGNALTLSMVMQGKKVTAEDDDDRDEDDDDEDDDDDAPPVRRGPFKKKMAVQTRVVSCDDDDLLAQHAILDRPKAMPTPVRGVPTDLTCVVVNKAIREQALGSTFIDIGRMCEALLRHYREIIGGHSDWQPSDQLPVIRRLVSSVASALIVDPASGVADFKELELSGRQNINRGLVHPYLGYELRFSGGTVQIFVGSASTLRTLLAPPKAAVQAETQYELPSI